MAPTVVHTTTGRIAGLEAKARSANGGVVLDCRWLGRGGVGMTTELTLRALAANRDAAAEHRWVLRGDATHLAGLAWDGAEFDDDRSDPHAWAGQSGWRRRQSGIEVAFHQVRPLSHGPRLQWLHDTIPLHFARNAADRRAKLAYLRRVVATADALLVDSRHTLNCVVDELGADPSVVRQITFPVDAALAAAVAKERTARPAVDRLLYIGRFLRHKNVPRLVDAFCRTEFARSGGELHLVGGSDDEVRTVRQLGAAADARITVEGSVPRSRVVELLATSAGLIQPSLEEGFGLPVWEARTVGLAVIASTGGSLPELITDAGHLFDPLDCDAMASAIDRMLATSSHRANEPAPSGPDLQTFGETFLAALRLVANPG